jgi:hypothetical protein
MEIDEYAKDKAIRFYALPPCLHIPIAARNESAIERFIGHIAAVVTPGSPNKALLIHSYPAPARNLKLPIWQLKEAAVLHQTKQLWVHVDFDGYRAAYAEAFPNEDLTDLVLDHDLNRRMARLKGFDYLRIVPISRAANSSSGGLPEKWGVEYHNTPEMTKINSESPAFIQYADLGDIVKMLNIKTGNSLQDAVNEAQSLVRESKT